MTNILASHPYSRSLGVGQHLLNVNFSKVVPKHLVYFPSQYHLGSAGKQQWHIFSRKSKLDVGIDPAKSTDDDPDKDEPPVMGGDTGVENSKYSVKRNSDQSLQNTLYYSFSFLGVGILPGIELSPLDISNSVANILIGDRSEVIQRLVLMDLDPAIAKLAIGLLGPFFSAFGFLFIVRIVMSWYPKLPVGKFPYVIAYAPTEPLLVPTRKLIPPLGGVDVTPVVWFGLISFLSEILVGPQGLLVLLSQQV